MPDTRRTMAQATGELLGRQSLADTTLAGIVEHSGAARGSLYHFFPGGKDQLVLDAVEVVGQILVDRLRAGSPTTPVEVGEVFLNAFRRLLRDDNASGCPLATVIVDAAPEPVHTRAAHWLAAWEAELATMYERVGVRRAAARQSAALFLAGCEGALVLSRAAHSADSFELVARALLAASPEATTRRRRR